MEVNELVISEEKEGEKVLEVGAYMSSEKKGKFDRVIEKIGKYYLSEEYYSWVIEVVIKMIEEEKIDFTKEIALDIDVLFSNEIFIEKFQEYIDIYVYDPGYSYINPLDIFEDLISREDYEDVCRVLKEGGVLPGYPNMIENRKTRLRNLLRGLESQDDEHRNYCTGCNFYYKLDNINRAGNDVCVLCNCCTECGSELWDYICGKCIRYANGEGGKPEIDDDLVELIENHINRH
jgi:hypothetical protein